MKDLLINSEKIRAIVYQSKGRIDLYNKLKILKLDEEEIARIIKNVYESE